MKLKPPNIDRDEPYLNLIQELAHFGLERVGQHGPIDSLGVPRSELPTWDDIQILTAQLATLPLADNDHVESELIIGKKSRRPLTLKTPLLVADMAFGSMSLESKIALARGAEKAGAAICSGESGFLPEEQQECSRYIFQLGSARWGYAPEKIKQVQALHLKLGQAAKTGTGGHLVGSKVKGRIAEVHGVPEGTTTIAPSKFVDLKEEDDYRYLMNQIRETTDGIPVGFKMSAQHIEKDLAAALRIGADYVILDGRGGATAAAPVFFRDHISVPTIPALSRARRFLDQNDPQKHLTLIITGGLRTPADFVKALALGADGIAVASSAIQAIGCTGERICHTNDCPAGIATQQEHLRARLNVDEAALNLTRFLESSVHLMKVMARACGHSRLDQFNKNNLTSWKKDMAEIAGISFAGAGFFSEQLKRPQG